MSQQARQQNSFWLRLIALVKKEFHQLWRDRSNLAIGILLPILLILIFGYGLSLDVKDSRIVVVMESPTLEAMDISSSLELSPYFSPLRLTSLKQAEQLMVAGEADAILHFSSDFARNLAAGHASIQLIVHGTDANTARIIQGYVANALASWQQKQLDRAGSKQQISSMGVISVEPRLWFNAANSSTWFLVPGLIVLIITLVGAMLTAMVMAKEWERGTLEALFVTPVKPLEILIAKVIPYFLVGIIGLSLCLLAAYGLFYVPMHGSLWIIIFSSTLYLLVSLGMGLVISAMTKNQFLACQMALFISFLPSMMLSGFLFDLRSTPMTIQIIGQLLPATYFMDLIKTLYLAGNVWQMVIKNCAILAIYAIGLLALALKVTHKRLA